MFYSELSVYQTNFVASGIQFVRITHLPPSPANPNPLTPLSRKQMTDYRRVSLPQTPSQTSQSTHSRPNTYTRQDSALSTVALPKNPVQLGDCYPNTSSAFQNAVDYCDPKPCEYTCRWCIPIGSTRVLCTYTDGHLGYFPTTFHIGPDRLWMVLTYLIVLTPLVITFCVPCVLLY